MPSGGGSALNEADWNFVRAVFRNAKRNDLEYEWLRWFAGSMVNEKMSVTEAAKAAAIEWDF